MRRKEQLLKILSDLEVLYTDLNRLIVEYDLIHWVGSYQWKTSCDPQGLTSDQFNLFLCVPQEHCILSYTLQGQFIEDIQKTQLTTTTLFQPWEIDFYQNHLYIIGLQCVYILKFPNKTPITSFPLPQETGDFRDVAIKVDNQIIYTSIADLEMFGYTLSAVLLYNTQGILQKEFKIPTHKMKKQFAPTGMDIFKTFLYICDWSNHVIWVLNKDNGVHQMTWGNEGQVLGEFYHPQCISIYDEIWYIGDFYSIQLFTVEGLCLERIESWKSTKLDRVYSICIFQSCLFLSDNMTKRIRVFE